MSGAPIDALAVAIAADQPVLLWGAPGVGKTTTVAAAAETSGRHLETVIAALHEPVDFAGLPIAQPDGTVRYAEPAWARRLAGSDRALLFLDEISLAAPAVQAALLRVVLDRAVGEFPLGDHVGIVAAANPVDQATGAFELSPPMANRFCHLDWNVDVDVIVAGFTGAWPTVDPTIVPDTWTELVPEALATVGAFLDRRRDLVLELPSDTGDCRGWPSPRAWESVGRIQAACTAAGVDDDTRLLLIAGLVGPGPAIELLTWLANSDLPATDAVLSAPDTVELPSTNDALWAVLGAVCSVVRTNPDRWSAAVTLCIRVADSHPDLAVRSARFLAACQPDDAADPEGLGVLEDVLRLSTVGVR